jgi:uncharacterized protein (DUF433 family)
MDDRIEIDPKVRHGQPVIRGTRVPVTRILSDLSAGTPEDRIAAEYGVSVLDVRAAVAFARELLDQHSFHPALVS